MISCTSLKINEESTSKDALCSPPQTAKLIRSPTRVLLDAADALASLSTLSSSVTSSSNKGLTNFDVKENAIGLTAVRRYCPAKAQTFPERLMLILQYEEKAGNDSISWLPNGKGFVIRSPNKFTLEVLPKFFKRTEFSSFTRKLYWWGFKKSSRCQDCDSFHHDLFIRDHPELCTRMKGGRSHSKTINGKNKSVVSKRQFDVTSTISRMPLDPLSALSHKQLSSLMSLNKTGRLSLQETLQKSSEILVQNNMQSNSQRLPQLTSLKPCVTSSLPLLVDQLLSNKIAPQAPQIFPLQHQFVPGSIQPNSPSNFSQNGSLLSDMNHDSSFLSQEAGFAVATAAALKQQAERVLPNTTSQSIPIILHVHHHHSINN